MSLFFFSLQPLGFCAPGATAEGVGRSRHSQCGSEALSLLQWRASLTTLVRYELTDTIILFVLCTGYKAATHITLCLFVLLSGPLTPILIFLCIQHTQKKIDGHLEDSSFFCSQWTKPRALARGSEISSTVTH